MHFPVFVHLSMSWRSLNEETLSSFPLNEPNFGFKTSAITAFSLIVFDFSSCILQRGALLPCFPCIRLWAPKRMQVGQLPCTTEVIIRWIEDTPENLKTGETLQARKILTSLHPQNLSYPFVS